MGGFVYYHAILDVHQNSLRNLVTFTDQDYVVTDFHIVKELFVQNTFMHQFYKVSVDSLWNRNVIELVELSGIEPLTPCVQGRCSPS